MPGGPAPASQDYATVDGRAARYRTLTRRLATASAAALLALWQRLEDGTLASDDLVMLGASSVLTANGQAYNLADLYLAHTLRARPLGMTAPADLPRLQQAVGTAASDQGTNPADALRRLGQSEPLQSGQTALTTGMKQHGVRGWTRQTGGASCQVCADLADGTVLSPDTSMWAHPGCSCVPQPVSGD
jgi:hypothetical protein